MKRGDVWHSRTGFPWVVDAVKHSEGVEVVQLRTVRHGTLMKRWWSERGLHNAGAVATGETLVETELEDLRRRGTR